MNFGTWLLALESTSSELYQSTVDAFPRTRLRQHATGTVKIVRLEWSPYLGVKTLFISGLAQNTEKGTEYRPLVVFKGVKYKQPGVPGVVEITASDEKQYAFEQLNYENNGVLVRCDCPDFRWRFNYYDWMDRSLFGNKRKNYEGQGGPPANPTESPGMCKHVMKLMSALREAGAVS